MRRGTTPTITITTDIDLTAASNTDCYQYVFKIEGYYD